MKKNLPHARLSSTLLDLSDLCPCEEDEHCAIPQDDDDLAPTLGAASAVSLAAWLSRQSESRLAGLRGRVAADELSRRRRIVSLGGSGVLQSRTFLRSSRLGA
jgi:hypothetical protein